MFIEQNEKFHITWNQNAHYSSHNRSITTSHFKQLSLEIAQSVKIFKKIKNLIKKIIKIPDLIESALINAETRGLTQ